MIQLVTIISYLHRLHKLVVNRRCCQFQTLPVTERNLDFFLRALHPGNQQSCLQEICHAIAIHKRNLTQSSAISMHLLEMRTQVSYCICLTKFSCKQLCWFPFSCKQLCWFPRCAGKKNLDFIQSLVAFHYSNIYYYFIGCHAFLHPRVSLIPNCYPLTFINLWCDINAGMSYNTTSECNYQIKYVLGVHIHQVYDRLKMLHSQYMVNYIPSYTWWMGTSHTLPHYPKD